MKKLFGILLAMTALLALAGCAPKTAKAEKVIFSASLSSRFGEITAIDTEDALVKITGISANEESPCGYDIDFAFENRSEDMACTYDVRYMAVNGVEIKPCFGRTLEGGESAEWTMGDMDYLGGSIFSVFDPNSDESESVAAEEITDIEITVFVNEGYGVRGNIIACETVHIYPQGEKKASKYVREAKDTDEVIIDNEYMRVTFIGTGSEYGSCKAYKTYFFIENKTDRILTLQADDVLLNGHSIYKERMYGNWFENTVTPGKCMFAGIYWFENALTDNGIEEIETLELVLRGYDEADTDPDDMDQEHIDNLFKETVVLKPGALFA